jgi:uncharacterized protein (TIGR04222 family)
MLPSNPPLLAAHSELWAKLLAFDLDGAAQFSFSKRLARDNGWPAIFAQRTALEYKRFLYLAATCGHPVTPSDEVDQAWHLHLVYTRSYWDDLCGQVLGFPLHHGPTKGGAAEGHKFRDWYAQTLRSYQTAFGTAPPADIWSPAAQRFGEAPYFQRLNRKRYFLLPRPQWRWVLDWRVGAALVGALVLAGCSARLPLNPLNWYGADFLLLFWSLCLTLVPLALWLRHRGRGPEEAAFGLPVGTYELARLANRGESLADSAFAAMAFAGYVELRAGAEIRRTGTTPPTDPYEWTVWQLFRNDAWSDLNKMRQRALQSSLTAVQALDKNLLHNNLLLSPDARQRLNRLPLFTVLGLIAFGLAKVLVGMSRGRPVGYLLLSLLVLGVVGVVCQHRGAWATGRGEALLQNTAASLQVPPVGPLSTRTVALTVALLGVKQLKVLGLGELVVLMLPPVNVDTGSDSSSGCGGGSSGCGGGGCGGCGGCGS